MGEARGAAIRSGRYSLDARKVFLQYTQAIDRGDIDGVAGLIHDDF
jgi:hypothetical protein